MAPTPTAEKTTTSDKDKDKDHTRTAPRTILIELQNSYEGWGDKYDVLEVNPDDQAVQDMLAQEHAVRVTRRNVTDTPDGLRVDDSGHQPTS